MVNKFFRFFIHSYLIPSLLLSFAGKSYIPIPSWTTTMTMTMMGNDDDDDDNNKNKECVIEYAI